MDEFELETIENMTKHACEKECQVGEGACIGRGCFVYEIKDILADWKKKNLKLEYVEILMKKMVEYHQHKENFHKNLKEREVCPTCAISEVIQTGFINMYWLDMVLDDEDWDDDVDGDYWDRDDE